MNTFEFLQAVGELGSKVISTKKSGHLYITDLTIAAALLGLLLLPAEGKDSTQMRCSLLYLTPEEGEPPEWFYIIPAEDYKP